MRIWRCLCCRHPGDMRAPVLWSKLGGGFRFTLKLGGRFPIWLIFLNWVETTNCRFIACNDYISILILWHMLNAQLNCNTNSNHIWHHHHRSKHRHVHWMLVQFLFSWTMFIFLNFQASVPGVICHHVRLPSVDSCHFRTLLQGARVKVDSCKTLILRHGWPSC